MTGFEPRTSGIWSDHSTNWATTTAPISKQIFVQYNWVQWRELYKRYNASECKTSNVQFSLVNTDRLSYKSFNCFFHVEINFIFSLSITHSLSLSLSLFLLKNESCFSLTEPQIYLSLFLPHNLRHRHHHHHRRRRARDIFTALDTKIFGRFFLSSSKIGILK